MAFLERSWHWGWSRCNGIWTAWITWEHMVEVRIHASQYPSCSWEYECNQIASTKDNACSGIILLVLPSWSTLSLVHQSLRMMGSCSHLVMVLSKARWWLRHKQPVDVIGQEGLGRRARGFGRDSHHVQCPFSSENVWCNCRCGNNCTVWNLFDYWQERRQFNRVVKAQTMDRAGEFPIFVGWTEFVWKATGKAGLQSFCFR